MSPRRGLTPRRTVGRNVTLTVIAEACLPSRSLVTAVSSGFERTCYNTLRNDYKGTLLFTFSVKKSRIMISPCLCAYPLSFGTKCSVVKKFCVNVMIEKATPNSCFKLRDVTILAIEIQTRELTLGPSAYESSTLIHMG
jgi:hypothetical protein